MLDLNSNSKVTLENFIAAEFSDKEILRYDLLLEEAIKFAQKFSGKIWTDFNYHDPGVTFLEYFSYAITDLAYRTAFPIPDLFLFDRDDFNAIEKNLLYGPARVFSSSPSSLNDYRKLIIDQIKTVTNAWVIPLENQKLGIRGLLTIYVEVGEDLSDIEKIFLKKEIERLFHANRMLGHDLESVIILKKVTLSIQGEISIGSDALAEVVLAKIHTSLENYINPKVERYDPNFLWKQSGQNPEEVFAGPLPQFGQILEKDLKPKVEVIFLSRIREIIMNVDGVREIKSLNLFKNGLPVFENFVSFEKDEFPKIQYLDPITEKFVSYISLFKNNVKQTVDPFITKQLINSELLSQFGFYLNEIDYSESLPKGRFTLEQLKDHIPIHLELPEFYGVGKNGSSEESSQELKISAKQLAAYLYFFEQVLASYLAQLANLRRLFSSEDLNATYFHQLPTKIPMLNEFIGSENEEFLDKLASFSNSNENFLNRRSRILNQLLARFGENLNDSDLKILSKNNPLDIHNPKEQKVLEIKTRYLNQILELGKNKAKGFDLKADSNWDSKNISGLELKIALSLGINDFKKRSLSQTILDYLQVKRNKIEKNSWNLELIQTSENEFEAFRLKSEDYGEQELHFFGKDINTLKQIFQLIINEQGIQVLQLLNKDKFVLLMKFIEEEYPFVAFESSSESSCLDAKKRFLNAFNQLDESSEGFHLIEHQLLRPLEPLSYRFSFFDQMGEEYISALFPSESKKQRALGEDLVSFGLIEDNYTIHKDEILGDYLIQLYDLNHEPIAEIHKRFQTIDEASLAIVDAIAYFEKIEQKEVDLEAVFEVNFVEGYANGFPHDFLYTDSLTFIFPNWPSKFQKADFIHYLNRLILENTPPQFAVACYFLDLTSLNQFEGIYRNWLEIKSQENPPLRKVDELSLLLIQQIKDFERKFKWKK